MDPSSRPKRRLYPEIRIFTASVLEGKQGTQSPLLKPLATKTLLGVWRKMQLLNMGDFCALFLKILQQNNINIWRYCHCAIVYKCFSGINYPRRPTLSFCQKCKKACIFQTLNALQSFTRKKTHIIRVRGSSTAACFILLIVVDQRHCS